MSTRFANTTKTQFDLYPSKKLLHIRIALHFLALFVNLYCAWFVPWALLALPILVFSYFWTTPTLISQISLQKDGHWQLIDIHKKSHRAQLQGDSWLHPLACALHFKLSTGKSLTLNILPDAMSKADFRHLRIAIKLATA